MKASQTVTKRSAPPATGSRPAKPAKPAPAKTVPAATAVEPPPPQSESSEEAAPPAPPLAGWRQRWLNVPSWAVSAFLHVLGLLVLALFTFAMPSEEPEMAIAAAPAEMEEFETVELAMEQVELEELPQLQATALDAGAASFSDLTLSAEVDTSDIGTGQLVEVGTVGEIGLMFGADGQGMSEAGAGDGVAYFFGVKTKGRRFVYVVDNSNSMSGGKFEMAVQELMRSVGGLSSQQQFYVIFFSDTAYPMFYPQPAAGMVSATEDNKRKLEYWLKTVHRCLRTDGRDAMRLAFTLRPDAIYVLGDGSFTDDTVDRVLKTPITNVTIHTLGFRMKPKAEQGFRMMAARFQGKFTAVEVTPQMVALSRQMNRPKNREQNGVWGIKLSKKK